MSLMQYFWNVQLMDFFNSLGAIRKSIFISVFSTQKSETPRNFEKKIDYKNNKNYIGDVLRHLLLLKTSIKESFQTFIYMLGQQL